MFVDPSRSLGGRGQELGGTSAGPKEVIACLALEVLAHKCPIRVLGRSFPIICMWGREPLKACHILQDS